MQCTVGATLRFALDDGDDQVNAAGIGAPLDAVTPQDLDMGAGADQVVAGPGGRRRARRRAARTGSRAGRAPTSSTAGPATT